MSLNTFDFPNIFSWLAIVLPVLLVLAGYIVGRRWAFHGKIENVYWWITVMIGAGLLGMVKNRFWDGDGIKGTVRPLLILSLIALGLWIGGRRVIRHRRRNNLCLTCGYDLTGNLSGICPECGHETTNSRGSAGTTTDKGNPTIEKTDDRSPS